MVLPETQQVIKKARKALAQPDALILVGSGVSLWSGLPSWNRLLEDLVDFVEDKGGDGRVMREKISDNDLLLAASLGAFQLKPQDLGSFVRKACKFETARPSLIHQKLVGLGPTCFITTNYDRLLEDAYSEEWGKKIEAVTNRQTIELPGIMSFHKKGFIFKYHGDVLDAESIILTREQYRKISGDFDKVSKTISTLLLTRPVIMVGFGLRDPDFLSIKETLNDAFQGSDGEHYAIMADMSDLEAEYWQENYNIQVIGYQTFPAADGEGKDHGALLDLLDSLKPDEVLLELSAEERLIRLGRLGERLDRTRPKVEKVFPLQTNYVFERNKGWRALAGANATVMKRLKDETQNFVLIGQPGAGKSFAMGTFASDLGRILKSSCLQDTPPSNSELFVPLVANLAQYEGDLFSLIQKELPDGLLVNDLLRQFPCLALLDGANETPREYIESGRLQEDLKTFMEVAKGSRVIIGSRPQDWLEVLDLPQFEIGDLDSDYVISSMSKIGVKGIEAGSNLLMTLNKPLFFSMAIKGHIDLEQVRKPRDVYYAFFNRLTLVWTETGQGPIDFVRLLAPLAFEMLNKGLEYCLAEDFFHAYEDTFGQESGTANTALDFLVDNGCLFVLPDRRLTFFHQSATEFLAAVLLAERYQEDPSVLEHALRDHRWDHALYLAMSLLPNKDHAETFFQKVLAVDPACAIRAVNYVHEGMRDIVKYLLSFLCENSEAILHDFLVESRIAVAVRRLPVDKEHAELLERLASGANILGGSAAVLHCQAMPESRDKHFEMLAQHIGDYNYVSGLSKILAEGLTIKEFSSFLDNFPQDLKRDDEDGLSVIIPNFLFGLPDEDKEQGIEECIRHGDKFLSTLLFFLDSWEAPLAGITIKNLIVRGVGDLAYSLMCQLRNNADFVSDELVACDQILADYLIDRIVLENQEGYALNSLGLLAKRNPEWVNFITACSTGLQKSRRLLLNAALDQHEDTNWTALKLAVDNLGEMTDEETSALAGLDAWSSAPKSLFLQAVLKRRSAFIRDISILGWESHNLPLLDHKPLEWWLEWLVEIEENSDLAGDRLGAFLSQADKDMQRALLDEINEVKSNTFKELLFSVVCRLDKVSTDNLSEAVIKRLTQNFEKPLRGGFLSTVLGHLATEDFVDETLLPMLESDKLNDAEKAGLRKILQEAGRQHNRRYVAEVDLSAIGPEQQQ